MSLGHGQAWMQTQVLCLSVHRGPAPEELHRPTSHTQGPVPRGSQGHLSSSWEAVVPAPNTQTPICSCLHAPRVPCPSLFQDHFFLVSAPTMSSQRPGQLQRLHFVSFLLPDPQVSEAPDVPQCRFSDVSVKSGERFSHHPPDLAQTLVQGQHLRS